jgi:uncharacterized protein
MNVFAFPILLVAGLWASASFGAPFHPVDPVPTEAIAASLIPRYASAGKPADLFTLFTLQLAASRFDDAEATLDRLDIAYRAAEPRFVPSLIPLRIYARAKRFEVSGASPGDALDRAFAELYATLPDSKMAEVLPWYSAGIDHLRSRVAEKEKACAEKGLAACPSAAGLIEAREVLATWTYLTPASDRLLRADLERRFLVDEQILVPTPDGAKIAVMVVRPRDHTPVKLTALLNFTIYAKEDWSMSDAVFMAAHGYAGVVAYTRGKGRSPDPVVPYVHDGEDAATVIGWLARQPWSDGRVGMFSGSYNGFTQWAAAKHHPPALKAIATNATNAPGIDTPMQGSVMQSFIYPWPFYTTDTKALDDATYGDTARWTALNRKWYVSGRPYQDLDRIDGKPNPVFDTWLKHPSYDAYWQRLIPYGREFASIDIPVFVQTGYYDGGMVGALYYFEEHATYRPSNEDRLLVGPYHHTAMQTGVRANIDGVDVDKAALVDLNAIRLQWFDHVFRGAPLPDVLSDRVNFEVMGADTWRHVSTLADMGTSPKRLYLTGYRDGSSFLFGDAPAAGTLPELVIDFTDRNDVAFESPAGTPDTRHALVFETAPLTKPLEVDGLFSARMSVTANKRDFDLAVQFYELRPDGRYLDLASYLGRVSYMRDRTRRALLQPGQPRILDFHSQMLTARKLTTGSRIVAVVSVPKAPDIQINYGTGRDVSTESIDDAGKPLRIRWSGDSYFDISVR